MHSHISFSALFNCFWCSCGGLHLDLWRRDKKLDLLHHVGICISNLFYSLHNMLKGYVYAFLCYYMTRIPMLAYLSFHSLKLIQ